jgi:hypothetical protein
MGEPAEIKAGSRLIAQICAELEAHRLEAAVSLIEQGRTQFPDAAEFPLLGALVMRRRTPGTWVDDVLAAWADTGRPSQLRFQRSKSIHEECDEFSSSIEDGAHPAAAIAHQTGSPLITLIALATEDQVPAIVARLPGPGTDGLWSIAFLKKFPRNQAASAATRRMLGELAATWPGDLGLEISQALIDTEYGTPLSADELHALDAIALGCTERLTVEVVFKELVAAREAKSAAEFEACLVDAMVMIPDELPRLHMRARRTLQLGVRSAETAEFLGRLGRKLASSRCLLFSLIGFAMLEDAARARGDPKEIEKATMDLAATRRLTANQNRFSLRWPIASLRIEACAEAARDEAGLAKRTLFPAASLH